MQENPYTLIFGKEPRELIERSNQEQEVTDAFLAESPAQQVFIVTGIRGAGKTVFMTSIARKFRCRKEWIVVELNPERDMLRSLAAKLSSDDNLAHLFQEASINLSFFGLGLEVRNTAPITDIETALTMMLENIRRKGRRVLILVDEVSNTQAMREFSSAFQILIRQNLPLCLLMTGLYENVNDLQNEKSLTFLYRAPKVVLNPLNLGMMAENYSINLDVDRTAAVEMARNTRGYSFAFQVLGYLTWNDKDHSYKNILGKYRQYLEEFVYEKIWSELSGNDRRIAKAIADTDSGKVTEIREKAGMDPNNFAQYRKRLIRKGILSGDEYGHVSFPLPKFREFVQMVYPEEGDIN